MVASTTGPWYDDGATRVQGLKRGLLIFKVTKLTRVDDSCGVPCDECQARIDGLHIHLQVDNTRQEIESFTRGFCSEGCALQYTSGMLWRVPA